MSTWMTSVSTNRAESMSTKLNSAKATYPTYFISGCVYLGEDCSRSWHMTMTMYGYCLQFTPWKPTKPKTTIGRQYFLSVSLRTNDSDWLTGWKSYMEGFTVFYSSTHEKTLDACYSINLNRHLVPIISMTRNTQFRLGQPYSTCEKHTHNDNNNHDAKGAKTSVSKYFNSYTKRQCFLDCFLRYTEETCHCRAFYFPLPVNRSDSKL